MIQAIQTHYDGYHFRSRLEARWAVFFNAANIPYEYEPEGFTVKNGKGYLPDFYLPESATWIDVKGSGKEVTPEWVSDRVPYLPKNEPKHESVHGLMILGPIPRLTKQDFDPTWAVFAPEGDLEIVGFQEYGFAKYHKNKRPWYECHSRPQPYDFTVPVSSEEPLDSYPDILRAYQAARSARFEHGEKPAA